MLLITQSFYYLTPKFNTSLPNLYPGIKTKYVVDDCMSSCSLPYSFLFWLCTALITQLFTPSGP